MVCMMGEQLGRREKLLHNAINIIGWDMSCDWSCGWYTNNDY